MYAMTWSVPGRRSRPSPTAGVGKWLACPPKEMEVTSWPLAGFRPWTALSPPIVQIRPPAMIGPPAAPSSSVHSWVMYGGFVDTLTAVTPFGQGT